MKKSVWSKNGMKQLINSGWNLFDKQTNCITTGNAWCNTQTSSYIRSYNETQCNGTTFPKGHLLRYDLRQFGNHRIPECIENIIFNKERTENVILYMFHTWDKRKCIEPFCWVVTDHKHKLIRYIVVRGYKQSFLKRYNAAKEAISYITE